MPFWCVFIIQLRQNIISSIVMHTNTHARFLFQLHCCLTSKVSLSIKNPLSEHYEFEMSLTDSRRASSLFVMKSTQTQRKSQNHTHTHKLTANSMMVITTSTIIINVAAAATSSVVRIWLSMPRTIGIQNTSIYWNVLCTMSPVERRSLLLQFNVDCIQNWQLQLQWHSPSVVCCSCGTNLNSNSFPCCRCLCVAWLCAALLLLLLLLSSASASI